MRHKVIVKNNLIYEARTLEPDEAMHVARANALLSPEAFTARYNGHTLELGSDGAIVRDLTAELSAHRKGLLPN